MISVCLTERDSLLNFLTATASPFYCKKNNAVSFLTFIDLTCTLMKIKKLIALVIAALINRKNNL